MRGERTTDDGQQEADDAEAAEGRGQGEAVRMSAKARPKADEPDASAPSVERLPVASLHLDPANLRRHPERNLDAIKSSLARFRQQRPILIDADNIVRAGNGTLQAAIALGWAEIDCVRTSLRGTEATAYAISDNRSAELAEWDNSALADTLKALESEDFDLNAVGFTAEEVERLCGGMGNAPGGGLGAQEAPEPQIDRAEELREKWGTALGQLWVIPSQATPGKEHRLLCGDSTNAEDVARVMGGEKALVMNTDPPYGVGYDHQTAHDAKNDAYGENKAYRTFPKIENDSLDSENLQVFLESAIRAALPHLDTHAAFYLWHPMLTQGTFFAAAAAAAANILIHRQIIWAKPHFIFGRGDYHWRHELCFYGWVKGNRPEFYGERNQDTVWNLDEGGGSIRKDQGHPTQKPVELFVRPIINHTKPGGVVYEPFSGSGSQYVAAEQTGRLCCGLEIHPGYVAVALERLSQMGLEPKLV